MLEKSQALLENKSKLTLVKPIKPCEKPVLKKSKEPTDTTAVVAHRVKIKI